MNNNKSNKNKNPLKNKCFNFLFIKLMQYIIIYKHLNMKKEKKLIDN